LYVFGPPIFSLKTVLQVEDLVKLDDYTTEVDLIRGIKEALPLNIPDKIPTYLIKLLQQTGAIAKTKKRIEEIQEECAYFEKHTPDVKWAAKHWGEIMASSKNTDGTTLIIAKFSLDCMRKRVWDLLRSLRHKVAQWMGSDWCSVNKTPSRCSSQDVKKLLSDDPADGLATPSMPRPQTDHSTSPDATRPFDHPTPMQGQSVKRTRGGGDTGLPPAKTHQLPHDRKAKESKTQQGGRKEATKH
jgi:hypothetical protein